MTLQTLKQFARRSLLCAAKQCSVLHYSNHRVVPLHNSLQERSRRVRVVAFLVSIELHGAHERPWTKVALAALDGQVTLQVVGQVATCQKGGWAQVAVKWLVALMFQQVRAQVSCRDEALCAKVAPVPFLARTRFAARSWLMTFRGNRCVCCTHSWPRNKKASIASRLLAVSSFELVREEQLHRRWKLEKHVASGHCTFVHTKGARVAQAVRFCRLKLSRDYERGRTML